MKRMLINATQPEERRLAIVDGQKLVDFENEIAGPHASVLAQLQCRLRIESALRRWTASGHPSANDRFAALEDARAPFLEPSARL